MSYDIPHDLQHHYEAIVSALRALAPHIRDVARNVGQSTRYVAERIASHAWTDANRGEIAASFRGQYRVALLIWDIHDSALLGSNVDPELAGSDPDAGYLVEGWYAIATYCAREIQACLGESRHAFSASKIYERIVRSRANAYKGKKNRAAFNILSDNIRVQIIVHRLV